MMHNLDAHTPFMSNDMTIVEFERKTDLPPVPNVGGSSAAERLLVKHLSGTVNSIREDGYRFSTAVDQAFAVVEAVSTFSYSPTTPSLAGLSPEAVTDALNAYIDARTRSGVAADARGLFLSSAVAELRTVLRDDLTGVLNHYRDAYAEAVTTYAEAHHVATGYASIGDLVEQDFDGSKVAAYHRARQAADNAERIVGLVLSLTTDKPQREDFYPAAVGLLVDLATAEDPTPVIYAADDLRRGTVTGVPFGRLPLIAECRGQAALPQDFEDWGNRIESYIGARDAAMDGLFRA